MAAEKTDGPIRRSPIDMKISRPALIWKLVVKVELAVVVGLFLFSACARGPSVEEEPGGCWPCENLPDKWYWDADEDGVDDFEISGWTFVPAVVGGVPSSYSISIRSIYEDRNVHPTNLLYPLEPGQWINANTEWKKYGEILLGGAECGEFEWWEGPFTEPEGDVFAFRIESADQNLVGVARFKMWECDGYIDILGLRIESELYGIIVGE